MSGEPGRHHHAVPPRPKPRHRAEPVGRLYGRPVVLRRRMRAAGMVGVVVLGGAAVWAAAFLASWLSR